MRLPAFIRIDVTKGYRWYTIGGGFDDPADGGGFWLKLGPVGLSCFAFDGRSGLELHITLWSQRRR